MSDVRGEEVPGGAAPPVLSSGPVGSVAEQARESVLANTTSEALAPGHPGSLAVHPLRTTAA